MNEMELGIQSGEIFIRRNGCHWVQLYPCCHLAGHVMQIQFQRMPGWPSTPKCFESTETWICNAFCKAQVILLEIFCGELIDMQE